MNDLASALDSVGTAAVVGIGVLVAVQLVLMVVALVSLFRAPVERLRAPKWMWGLVIVLGQIAGPIVYFVLARKPEQVDVAPAQLDERSQEAGTVADMLYGDSNEGAS